MRLMTIRQQDRVPTSHKDMQLSKTIVPEAAQLADPTSLSGVPILPRL